MIEGPLKYFTNQRMLEAMLLTQVSQFTTTENLIIIIPEYVGDRVIHRRGRCFA